MSDATPVQIHASPRTIARMKRTTGPGRAGGRGRGAADLDAGGRLVALQQNVTGTPDALIGMRGEKVRLVWSKEYEYRVGSSA